MEAVLSIILNVDFMKTFMQVSEWYKFLGVLEYIR